jgi:hypothetical protein
MSACGLQIHNFQANLGHTTAFFQVSSDPVELGKKIFFSFFPFYVWSSLLLIVYAPDFFLFPFQWKWVNLIETQEKRIVWRPLSHII